MTAKKYEAMPMIFKNSWKEGAFQTIRKYLGRENEVEMAYLAPVTMISKEDEQKS